MKSSSDELLQRLAMIESVARETIGDKPMQDGQDELRGLLDGVLSLAERAVLPSSAQYRDLFELAGDALFVENERDEVIDVNKRACDLLGYTRDELLGMTVSELQAPEIRGVPGSVLREELATHNSQPFEAIDLHRDGTRIPVEVSLTPLNENGVYLSIVRDIRERKQVEAARAETYQIIENSPVVVFLWRNAPHWPVEFVSGNVDRVFGYSPDDLLKGSVKYSSVVHPDDLDRVAAEVAENSTSPNTHSFQHRPYRIVAADGSVHWVEDNTNIRRNDLGEVTHYQGTVVDITERVMASQQLAALSERLMVTLRSIGDAVITTDPDGRVSLMNPVAERLTGWSEADASGQKLNEVFTILDERTRMVSRNPVEQVLASGKAVGLADHTILVARDGTEHSIGDSGAPIVDHAGEVMGVVLVFRDITRQLRMEAEMLKMEKLDSLGVLAGGLAHDFNNFLTGIIGNLSLARADCEENSAIAPVLDAMETAAVRATDLTQQLLTFSRGGQPVVRVSPIRELVHESAQFALRGSNVRLDFEFDKTKPVRVDRGQLTQVIHNLVINADQAMPEGGTVFVRGSSVELPSGNGYALDPGEYVRVCVSDEGPGIPPDVIKRVFDPYFTTKPQGSGLGLAVAYSIVSKHDGQLTVSSPAESGSRFTILLPASDEAVTEDDDVIPGSHATGGRILIMDDEEFIRDLLKRMLVRAGYAVDTAPHGEAAVKLYRESLASHRYDVVMLDLTVKGGMGGKAAIGALLDLDPNARVIVSSGYSNDPVMANYADYGFCNATKKPFLADEVISMIESVIAASTDQSGFRASQSPDAGRGD